MILILGMTIKKVLKQFGVPRQNLSLNMVIISFLFNPFHNILKLAWMMSW